MQDISLLPTVDLAGVTAALRLKPIDEKMMKSKVDRFQSITSYSEQEYLPDVVEGYAWLVLANHHLQLRQMLAHEKLVRPFCEEFLKECVKHLILCKKFYLPQLMVVVQQFLLESLVFFQKHLHEIDKVPKMVALLKTVLDIDRQFYRLNAQTDYPHMPVQPTKEEIAENFEFVQRLKVGDIVDALKSDYYGKRMCWSRARITKIGYSSMQVEFLSDRKTMDRSIDKKCFELAPVGAFTSGDYEWRMNMKVGDEVDYEETSGCWRRAKVEQVRETDEDFGGKYLQVRLDNPTGKEESDFYANELLPATSSKIQPLGLITSTEQEGKKTFGHQLHFDDYNDLILDQKGLAAHAIVRGDSTKSLVFVQLVNRADQMGIFTQILQSIQQSVFPVQVCADLVHIICLFQGVFNRRFAIVYLRDLADAVVQYLKRIDEANIRNFSKDRCDNLLVALHDFYRRLLPAEERRRRIQLIKLDLSLKFINSDFLERKMHAITTITEFVRLARGHFHQSSYEEVCTWILKNDLLRKIFNEKSHPQLMSRAMEFIKLYLQEQPELRTLDPFLETNETMLKVSNELFESFPRAFREALVSKIISKENVTNKDALEIIKKQGGNESWLLKNGGEGWVDVIKLKKKRSEDLKEALQQRFEVVQRITRQVSASHDGKFRSEFFDLLESTNYLHQVIDMPIPIDEKTEFCEMVISNALEIPESLFSKLIDLWEAEENPTEETHVTGSFYQLYELVLTKLDREQVRIFFDKFFSSVPALSRLREPSFQLFRSSFLKINEGHQFIDRKYNYFYADSLSTKKQKKEVTVITVNPNKLVGMTELMNVVFSNERLEVVQAALEFIGFLFDHLAKNLASSVKEFKQNFLQQCLERLYTSSSYEKYLKIIENILNESEKDGNGGLNSLESVLPPQKVKLLVIDGFNAIKHRIPFETTTNTTLYELRFLIGKNVISAYVNEMNILTEEGLLDERLNGLTVHQAGLTGPLTIERRFKIDRAPLLDGNNLSKDATRIFSKIFSVFSTNGLMSKQECQKYHQKCVGEMAMSYGENKVGEIYETYDTDKDGFLTLDDFLKFYEKSIRARETTVWSNLEAMGVRNDLKILDDLEIVHVDPQTLIRTLLVSDERFMGLLFKILNNPEENNRRAAWRLLQRLPLCESTSLELFDLKNTYALRYWLYIVDHQSKFNLITHQLLQQILQSDKETLAIGLQVASHVKGLDLPIFKQLIGKLREVNNRDSLDFYQKIILDYSLKLIVSCLASSPEVSSQYTVNHRQYEQLFLSGLMSSNSEVRSQYSQACRKILVASLENNFALFQIIFRMVYENFEKCKKESLFTEYFELYSELLEMLRRHPEVLEKLQLNWMILTRSIIDLFRSHKCTEERLSSPVDWVVQGFMRILSKLLNQDTLHNFVELVPYLFQNLLFPDGGRNKLKTAATRKQAYELIYNICASQDPATTSPSGLQLLFQSGFKRIYKTMSTQKVQTYSYYYYNTFNEIRSEFGYAGIRNLGCICYMIAMIQQFYMTKPFRYLLLMADDQQPQNLVKRGLKEIDDNLLHQFQSMFANLELTERQEYNPDEFCFSFKDFDGNPVNVGVQQDAQEFLNMIFDKLEKGVKDTPFRQVLDSVYGGRSCTQLTCSECKAVKQRHENFYNLSLEVKGYQNIDGSFRKFISGQTIADYKCDACGKKCDITKRCLLSQLPNYLIVHLQRICFNYDKFENEKVNSRWEFPHNLNVYDYTVQKQQKEKNSEEFQYQLKGIVVHIGSAEYGHYFSFIKTSPQQWLEFNDERVRQFDPKDIETECFGGEHWRRENQSAYLLVYEKKVKGKALLEFESQQQLEQLAKSYGLKNLLQPIPTPVLDASPSEDIKEKEEETQPETSQKGSEQTTETKEVKPQEPPKPPKVKMLMDFDKVPAYVPERLVTRINKSNEEFSMNLNVSNNEFAQFVYRILSIDPPKSLRVEYLDLCFECFHLKQNIEGSDLSIADWMAKRFRELIVGSGWQFLSNIQNWQKEILAQEKTARISMRNLLNSVLSDIIQTYKFNDYTAENLTQNDVHHTMTQIPEDLRIKITKVIALLDSFTELMHTDIPRNWMRFEEYFEVWADLIRENQWMRSYAINMRLVARLLGFILQDQSPFKFSTSRVPTMGTKYTEPHFEYPLEVLALLIQGGAELTPEQKSCLYNYNFLQSLTKHHPKSAKMIDMVCRDNAVNSERMAYLFNYNISKVSHSDDVKPLIEGVHQFIAVDDGLRPARIEWLLGYPQLVWHPNTSSFGMFGLYSLRENVFTFRSAVRFDPVLHMNLVLEKNQHISALLISMLLQLEKNGYISLNDYPPTVVNNEEYTSEFNSFVASYYEESRRSYKGSHYIEYGEKLKELWSNRVAKPRLHKNWLIGSTISSKQIRRSLHGSVEIVVVDCTVAVVESNHVAGRNESIPTQLVQQRMGTLLTDAKLLKKYKNSELFIGKPHVLTYMHTTYELSDDEESKEAALNPFEAAEQLEMVRKITFKNSSITPQLVVIDLQIGSENVWPRPVSKLSFLVEDYREEVLVLLKQDPHGEWGTFDYTVQSEATARNISDDHPTRILTKPTNEDPPT